MAYVLAAVLSVAGGAQAGEGAEAREQLRFTQAFASQCYRYQAKMQQVANTAAERAIKVYLERYLGEVRQPGRTVNVLAPGGEPVALGCTRVGGHPQRWEVVRAQFVD